MRCELPVPHFVPAILEYQHADSDRRLVHIQPKSSLIHDRHPSSFAGSWALRPGPIRLCQPRRPDHIHDGLHWSRTDPICSPP